MLGFNTNTAWFNRRNQEMEQVFKARLPEESVFLSYSLVASLAILTRVLRFDDKEEYCLLR